MWYCSKNTFRLILLFVEALFLKYLQADLAVCCGTVSKNLQADPAVGFDTVPKNLQADPAVGCVTVPKVLTG